MPIINKPASFSKGQNNPITLTKALLLALVAEDEVFGDTTNWKSVDLIYKSTTGQQVKVVPMDANNLSAVISGNLHVSLKGRNNFTLQSIVIHDFDNDSIKITRAQLLAVESAEAFDVGFGGSGPVANAFTWTPITTGLNYSLLADGGAERAQVITGGGYASAWVRDDSNAISGDFEIKFEATLSELLNGCFLGVTTNTANSIDSTGLCGFYLEGTWTTFYQGSSQTLSQQPSSGLVVFKLVREGDIIKSYLNDTLVSTVDYNVTADVYAVMRLGGKVSKAYLVSETVELSNRIAGQTVQNISGYALGFTIVGNPSNGIYDGTDVNNYMYAVSSANSAFMLDLQTAQTVQGFGICMSNFGNTLQHTPTQIQIYGSSDGVNWGSVLETFNYVRADWQAGVRKDINFSTPRTFRYFRFQFPTVDVNGGSLTISEISAYNS